LSIIPVLLSHQNDHYIKKGLKEMAAVEIDASDRMGDDDRRNNWPVSYLLCDTFRLSILPNIVIRLFIVHKQYYFPDGRIIGEITGNGRFIRSIE